MRRVSPCILYVAFIIILALGCNDNTICPNPIVQDNSVILAYKRNSDIWFLMKNLESINVTKGIVDTFYRTNLSQFSNDGTKFLFTVDYCEIGPEGYIERNRDDIFVYDLILKSLTRLTDNEKKEFNPQFLPNSNEVVYFEKTDLLRSSMKALDYYTGNIRTIVDEVNEVNYYPSISNDGLKIAFDSFNNGKREIYVIYSTGLGLQKISSGELSEFNPVFSPDGRHIYYYLYEMDDQFSPVIYKRDISTGFITKITNKEQAAYAPQVSLDGKLISCLYFDRSWIWVCLMDSSGNGFKKIGKGSYSQFNISNKLIYLGTDGIYEYSNYYSSMKMIFAAEIPIFKIRINPVCE